MVDPRLLAARAALAAQQPASRGNVQQSPMQRLALQQAAANAAKNKPSAGSREDWVEQMKAAAVASGHAKSPKAGGAKGLLGTVLGNPIVSGALKPLEYLSIPMKGIQQGLIEGSMNGLLPSMDAWIDEDRVNADTRSVWDKITDPNTGMGDYLESSGNLWVDRATGFLGDVVTDPLTYLTFGAGKLAGGSGRVATAMKLLENGADVEDVAKGARLGVMGMDDALREGIGVGEHGFRFGTKNHNVIVPGTRRISEEVGGAMVKARAAVGDTRVGSAFRKVRDPEGIAAQMDVLTGRAAGNKRAAGAAIGEYQAAKLGGSTTQGMFARQVRQWERLGDDEAVAATHAAEKGLVPEWKQYNDDLYGELQKSGASGVAYRENRVMHVPSPEYREYAKLNPEFAGTIPVRRGDSVGGAFARKFEPGKTYTFPEGTVTLGDASIDDINTQIGGLLGFKILEDDIRKIAVFTLNVASEDVGTALGARYLKNNFADLAVEEAFDEAGNVIDSRAMGQALPAHLVETVNKKATRKANDKAAKGFKKLLGRQDGDVKALRSEIRTGTKEAKAGAVASFRDLISELESVSAATKRSLKLAVKAEADGRKVTLSLNDRLKVVLADTNGALDKARSKLVLAEAYEADKAARLGVAQGAVAKAGIDRRVARKRILREQDELITRLEGDKAAIERMVASGADGNEVGAVGDALRLYDDELAGVDSKLAAETGPVRPDLQQELQRVAGVQSRAADRVTAAQDGLVASGLDQQQKMVGVLGEQSQNAAQIAGAQADQVSGAADMGTYQAMLADAHAQLDSIKGLETRTAKDIRNTLNELDAVVSQFDTVNDPQWKAVADQLASVNQMVVDLQWAKWDASNTRGFLKAAKAGKFTQIMQVAPAQEWSRMGKELLSDAEGMLIHKDLAEQMTRFVERTSDGKWVEVLDNYTKFFKTYATMSPGFHLRNGMSAMFMNFTEGVSVKEHADAFGLFRRVHADPKLFNTLSIAEQDAFRMTWSSGVAGQFMAAELGEFGTLGVLTDNVLTRLSRAAGEFVEGPARLALAMNSVKRGDTAVEGLARLTRIHFDYSEMSKFDQKMKRIIPFWTFMSRNLPLQVTQMWLKPKAYAHYNSFKRNFDTSEEGDIVPASWRAGGAFKLGIQAGGNELYAMPDLPFTRLDKEVENLGDPLGFLASANPLLRVPAEIAANRKAFTKQEFYPDENKLLYALLNMVPAASQVDRLSGGKVTGAFGGETEFREDKQAQSIASYFGIPIKDLTPTMIDAELRRIAKAG